MRLFFFLSGSLFFSFPLFSKGYITPHPDHPFFVTADFRAIGQAPFRSSRFRHSHATYADSSDGLYYTLFINPRNSLSFELSYSYLKFDWDQNPRFREGIYNYGDVSLSWISTAWEKWLWIITNGVTVDAKEVNFKESGVFYTSWWGRYSFTKDFAGHLGVLGYAGIRNHYILPILGFDWQMARAWRLHAIFPYDLSLRMYVHPEWFFSLRYASFGYYRYPRRASGGIGKFDRAIFDLYSKGVELGINYATASHFEAGIGGGWNLGGWIHIKDRHNHHPKYFRYKGAPYGHAYLSFNF